MLRPNVKSPSRYSPVGTSCRHALKLACPNASRSALRKKLDDISNTPSFKFTRLDQWYGVTNKALVSACKDDSEFRTFLRSNPGGLVNALLSAYPDHNWQVWRFHKVPVKWWADKAHRQAFLDDFANSKQFKSMDDWYSVHVQHVRDYKGQL